MNPQTDSQTAEARADSLQRLVTRRNALQIKLNELNRQIRALKSVSKPRPPDGQRIRLYRNWNGKGREYLEGVFFEKNSKRPGGKSNRAHIVCDDGGYAGFKVVGNGPNKHPGWEAV